MLFNQFPFNILFVVWFLKRNSGVFHFTYGEQIEIWFADKFRFYFRQLIRKGKNGLIAPLIE